jgi:mono/diheme cytochrome c family protein
LVQQISRNNEVLKMKRVAIPFLLVLLLITIGARSLEAAKKVEYLLPGDVKEGWRVFIQKKCGDCHAIWGEGGKGGPDLGTLPQAYVSQTQLAALMWNHGPEMWGRMAARKIPLEIISTKEMADLFAFLYFLRYMDEPGNLQRGKSLLERVCGRCHIPGEGTKSGLSRWAMYTNPILWAQMMWNHSSQMEKEMKAKGIPHFEFAGNEMVDLISYIRSLAPGAEKVYLSPGDPKSGEKLYIQKGCIQCHIPRSEYDLSKKKEFPNTLGQLAGVMWNHSEEMRKGMERRGISFPALSSQEMADLVAYLFSTRYFDEPGNPEKGKTIFVKKQCNFCHVKGDRTGFLSRLKGLVSPIFMAQTMWNHGPEMLEKMRKAKGPWQKMDRKEMVDLMEYLNQGMVP